MGIKLVSIAAVEPGQVVARPVMTAEGVTLCPAGFLLTESAIQRLKNAGVETVAIESGEGQRQLIEARLTQLDVRFRDVTDPAMLQIKATVKRRLEFLLAEAAQ